MQSLTSVRKRNQTVKRDKNTYCKTGFPFSLIPHAGHDTLVRVGNETDLSAMQTGGVCIIMQNP